jgi:hypothetical protein
MSTIDRLKQYDYVVKQRKKLMQSWNENRKNNRVSFALPLIYERFDEGVGGFVKHVGVSRNYSDGGLYFLAPNCRDQSLVVHQVLKINIADITKARAKIIRIDQLPWRSPTQGIALEFLEFDE